MAKVLQFSGVSVRRGLKNILHDVYWQVYEGEHWVVLGPNGAGKTTLLQLAAARMHPTSGTVDILGERLGKVDVFDLRPRVGFASAALSGSIPGHELVRDAVVTGAYAVTGRWNEEYAPSDVERATNLLTVFSIDSLAERMFGTLSEGEVKRVQIARALMSDPEILLLDEPSAGLDVGGREMLIAAMAELASDRRSPVLIMVTHHVEEIPPGFTHVALLVDGSIEEAGPIENVLTGVNVSRAFGLPLAVEKHDGRWTARGLGRY